MNKEGCTSTHIKTKPIIALKCALRPNLAVRVSRLTLESCAYVLARMPCT